MNRVLERSRVLAADAIVLFRTILSNQIKPQLSSSASTSSQTFKTLLLEQANVPYQNQFAIKLLHYEKEYNLLRYHGFVEYSKSKLLSNQYRVITNSIQPGGSDQIGTDNNNNSIVDNSTSAVANVNVNTVDSDSKENTDDRNTTTTNITNKQETGTTKRNVAKIAFMITTSMRNELTTRLQYTTNDIKTMTPLEASLILHNNVIPSDRNSTVPILLEQYEKEQNDIRIQIQLEQEEEEKRQQEELLQLYQQEREQEEQLIKEKLLQQKEQKKESTTEHFESTATIPAHSVIRSYNNVDDDDIMDDTRKQQRRRRLWFELVKINNITPTSHTTETNDDNNNDDEKYMATTSTTEVIGLYTTEKEAVCGLETHQFFAEREIKRNEISKVNNKKNHHSSTSPTRTTDTTPAAAPKFEIRESWR